MVGRLGAQRIRHAIRGSSHALQVPLPFAPLVDPQLSPAQHLSRNATNLGWFGERLHPVRPPAGHGARPFGGALSHHAPRRHPPRSSGSSRPVFALPCERAKLRDRPIAVRPASSPTGAASTPAPAGLAGPTLRPDATGLAANPTRGPRPRRRDAEPATPKPTRHRPHPRRRSQPAPPPPSTASPASLLSGWRTRRPPRSPPPRCPTCMASPTNSGGRPRCTGSAIRASRTTSPSGLARPRASTTMGSTTSRRRRSPAR